MPDRPLLVIDISHHQPEPIAWDKVLASGVLGVIHKATEGTRYVDPKLFSRMHDAKLAGLMTMTYHFLRPGSMAAQVEHYLGTIDPVPGERVVIDHEDEGVPLADLEACVKAIRRQRPDLGITIYSGHLIKDQLDRRRSPILAESTDLWIAQYTTAAAPSWPRLTWPAWSLWQYTDTARVPGIAGRVDGNRFNGTADELRRWMTPAGSAPDVPIPVEPEPAKPPILVAITVPPGAGPVTVTINGEILVTA